MPTPACPYGARATAAGKGLQVWVDQGKLALDLVSLFKTYAPLTIASMSAQLVDIEAMCAANPPIPEPITVQDIVASTANLVTAGLVPGRSLLARAYEWLHYQEFLQYCECIDPPTTPGHNCVTQASISLPNPPDASVAYPFTVDQSLLDTWRITGPSVRSVAWSGSWATVGGGASITPNHVSVDLFDPAAGWFRWCDLADAKSRTSCTTSQISTATPLPPVQSQLRLFNFNLSPTTVTQFNLCLCPATITPPPLPVQPPITTIQPTPTLLCDDATLCAAINELSHRLSIIAGQVSDIQAIVGGADQLQVLESHPISGEGEITLALGTRAVSVELLALGPDVYTSALGRPRGLMRAGSVRFGDGIGYSPRQFIDADKFDATRPTGALSVSYQLLPGTTGTLKLLA